ncbi:hypothetical protein Trydic_g994 [Trypoxylus dichotomus]
MPAKLLFCSNQDPCQREPGHCRQPPRTQVGGQRASVTQALRPTNSRDRRLLVTERTTAVSDWSTYAVVLSLEFAIATR